MFSLRALRAPPSLRTRLSNISVRRESTKPSPPLLLQLRTDLKASMRAKDTQKLNVIRAILSDITDASKTSKPAETDMHILSFVHKRIAQGKASAEEFAKDGRQDLQEKEAGQVGILESYASTVQTLGDEEVRQAVAAVLSELGQSGGKVNKGLLMKKLVGPGGSLEGAAVERAAVAQAVDAAIASSS